MKNDDIIDLDKVNDIFQNLNFKKVFGIILAIVIAAFFFSIWFTVGAEEVGVILRFGKYNRTIEPGLNYKLPFGIEEV